MFFLKMFLDRNVLLFQKIYQKYFFRLKHRDLRLHSIPSEPQYKRQFSSDRQLHSTKVVIPRKVLPIIL